MGQALEIGDVAPNFDLTSTEDVILMLRDEVPRTPVLLFFFADLSAVQNTLSGLAAATSDLGRSGLRLLGISAEKLDALKAAQNELKLPFPLLHDDRNFSAGYGIGSTEDGLQSSGFVLVNRDQTVLWSALPAPSAQNALTSVAAAVKGLSSSTANYPRAVINRIVDLWVN